MAGCKVKSVKQLSLLQATNNPNGYTLCIPISFSREIWSKITIFQKTARKMRNKQDRETSRFSKLHKKD